LSKKIRENETYANLSALVALASPACQDDLRRLKLQLERARIVSDALDLCREFQKKLDAFREHLETERERHHVSQEVKPHVVALNIKTEHRGDAVRRIMQTYQKLKAQLEPAEQKMLKAMFRSSGVRAAIDEAREILTRRAVEEKKSPATPAEPSPPRSSPEERLVRAKLAVLRACAKPEGPERDAAIADLDDLLPREYEIAKTRVQELYEETQQNRPLFIADVVQRIADHDLGAVLEELAMIYHVSVIELEREATEVIRDQSGA